MQGKYWEMHDTIFANQAAISDDLFMKTAQNLGLNDGLFVADSISKRVRSKINTDFETGVASGVNGTPAFFIDGKRFDGGPEDLYELISVSVNE